MIALYYIGRAAQLLGMWLLLVDVFTAGPLGPDAKLFAVGVAVFLGGWALTRTVKQKCAGTLGLGSAASKSRTVSQSDKVELDRPLTSLLQSFRVSSDNSIS